MNTPIRIGEYYDPNTGENIPSYAPRQSTLDMLLFYSFKDDTGRIIDWTPGQIEIIDCIVNRSAPTGEQRIEIIASTQYGKSIAVGAAVAICASIAPEKWAIVAGTKEKARIIMDYVVMFSLNNSTIRSQLTTDTSLDRLRMKKNSDRLTYKRKGEVRVFSADSGQVSETSKSLMGMGAPNVIEDEASLISDTLQATVMRMLGGSADNFLVKIGNPFNRGHFLRTWTNGKYHRVFIDYKRALAEGRYTQSFIDEMQQEALFEILYGCLFPQEGTIDNKGWLQLLTESDVERAMVDGEMPFGDFRLGNDVAGGGRNYSVSALRAYNVAKIVYKEHEPDTMLFVGKIVQLTRDFAIKPTDVFIDKVGIGKGSFDRLREIDNRIVGVNAGESPSDQRRFVNLRAEMYWSTREWILKGGKLERNDDWYELCKIKYKVADSSGKIKIMSKEEMLKEGIDSPDVADSLSLTFAKRDMTPVERQQQDQADDYQEPNIDPY